MTPEMTIEMFLVHPVVHALGQALLHLLWQGSVLAVLVWVVKTITPAPRVRYAAASLILLMMPVALVVTTTKTLVKAPRNTAAVARPIAQAMSDAPKETVLYAPTAVSSPKAGISGWVVCGWITGVLLLSLRAAGGWTRAQHLKNHVRPATAALGNTLNQLKLRLAISAPVRLCTSMVVQVPTVIGSIRPYILLPVTTITGLTESRIEAILAHELAHIRRHDYLVNLLQTAIETVLFYHPAVWWVGKQMRIEREHCCDDIAVIVCGNAKDYARALAELEELRCRLPEPALAATGGDLLGRIRRILGQQEQASRSLGTLVAASSVLLLALVVTLQVVALQAAPQEAPPAFEVASIKQDVSGQPGPRFEMFPGFKVERATLRDLILMAYRIHGFQLSGSSGWINSDRYNINAKAQAPPVFNQDYRLLQERRLQTLLQDRFKLAVHRETRELPIYELTVAKGGPKLQPTACIQREPGDRTIAAGKAMGDYCGFSGTFPGRYEATSGSMSDLSAALSGLLERIVVNKTGISGTFHLQLSYVPDDSTIRLQDLPGVPPPPADGPAIFTALQEQLGLKLESAKGPVEVLVIDHVETPSEN
jgi:uncharacterized protein (TIGR03435 family)